MPDTDRPTSQIQPADHRRAQAALAGVLATLDDAQLAEATPCTAWTVSDVLVHVIGGNRRIAGLDELPGPPATAAEAREQHAESAAAAQAVFDAPGALERVFTLPVIGEVPGVVVLQLRTTDSLTHAWDIATATGQSTDLDPELAQALLAGARRLVQPGFRGEGRPFAAEEAAPAGATHADELAAFLGRRRP